MTPFPLQAADSILLSQVYFWTTIRKNRNKYAASRGLREEDVAKIIQTDVIKDKNLVQAEKKLLQLPGLKKFVDRLRTEREKERFRRHLRKYISIYLPDCAFEVNTTNRYTILTHEAAVTARKVIEKGEVIKHLSGVQVQMTPEEEADLDLNRRDFSIVMSSRKKAASIFLGPARFANHDCNSNAKLMTAGNDGMEVRAVRDIALGEEITVKYGDGYFGEDNCECLCHTCEMLMRNGWAPPSESGVSTPVPTPLPVEPSDPDSPYSFRRKRKYGSDHGSQTPSMTPDAQTPVKRRRLDHMSASPRSRKYPNGIDSPVKMERVNSRLRHEIPGFDSDQASNANASSKRVPEDVIRVDLDGISSMETERVVVEKQVSAPSVSLSSGQRQSTHPERLYLDPHPSIEVTDAEEFDLKVLQDKPLVLKENSSDDQGSPSSSGQADSLLSVSASTTDATSVSEDTVAIKQEICQKATEESRFHSDKAKSTEDTYNETFEVTPDVETAAKTRKRWTRKKPIIEEPQTPKERVPGDYHLTKALLYDSCAAWVACTICDTFFVQPDAYFTRAACPRCERHSKLYGYGWPKTEKAGKHDTEERVRDHRTIHRFLDREAERDLGKGKIRGLGTRSMSRAVTEESVKAPVVEKRKRVVKKPATKATIKTTAKLAMMPTRKSKRKGRGTLKRFTL